MFDNVFSLLIQKSNHDENKPWIQNKTSSIGTGILISWLNVKMILTNEHVVRNATYICAPSHDRMELHVRFSSKVHDLALLIPEEQPSWLDKFAAFEVPTKISIKLGQPIQIIGFPRLSGLTNCGENALVSNGTISRILDIDYNQSETNVICQLVAATDFGSSGGPVLCTQKCTQKLVGVASYRLETGRSNDVRDVCYMIPLSIINHFLETFTRGSKSDRVNTKSFCDLGIVTSLSYSPILRNFYLGLTALEHGVLISSSDVPEIFIGDFMMTINNRTVSKSGMIWDEDLDGHVPYWYAIKMTHPGDKLHMQLIRNKQIVDICMLPQQKSLQTDDGKYVQFGSMFFTQPLHYFGNVVLSEFTHNTKMQGYDLHDGIIVTKINDKQVKNIMSLKKRLSRFVDKNDPKNDFVKLEFSNGDIVITPADVQVQSNF